MENIVCILLGFFLHQCVVTLPGYLFCFVFYLFQIVGCGNFATVWRGTYNNSTVAVKVFPAGWKHIFTAEKEVYELPLMKHSGIIDFLGTGRKHDGESWLIVLQFAEFVSGPCCRMFCSFICFIIVSENRLYKWYHKIIRRKEIKKKHIDQSS